jgi:hypothetical protein
MALRRSSIGLTLLALVACTPPGSLSDGLEPPAQDGPSSLPDVMFPNAPTDGWLTVGAINWDTPVPFRRDPVYEPNNASGMVDYGDDDPNAVWSPQTATVTDAGLPGDSRQNALELRMPRGLSGGYAPSKVGQHPDNPGRGPLRWEPSENTGHLYIGFYVRFSPNYDLNGNMGQKVLYLKSDRTENRELAHMVGIMVNDGNGGNQLWPTYAPQTPFGRYQVASTAQNDLNDGGWHLIEYLQGPNTPGLEDSTLQAWVDGRPEGTWTNAKYFDFGQVPTLNRLEISPIYGGGNRPMPADQWVRVGPMLVRSR